MLLSTPPAAQGTKAPVWKLRDVISGNYIDLQETSQDSFVVAFICNHCPYVVTQISDFVQIANRLQAQGVKVYAVMSNNYDFYTSDDPEHMRAFAQEHQFTFPYLIDEDQSVASAYEAICTPDIFGINADGEIQYRGAIQGLEEAMNQIQETGVGPQSQTPSQGCSIKWK